MRFLKRFLFVLFFQILAFLTVFYVNESFYPQWAVLFLASFLFFVFLSTRIVPSRRKQMKLNVLVNEYQTVKTLEEDIRLNAMKLELKCPSCGKSANYWNFLEDYKCPHCTSELWSSKIKEQDEGFEKLLKKKERVNSFYSRIPFLLVRKIKRLSLAQKN